jgi:amino acid adenylation domain-containing protein
MSQGTVILQRGDQRHIPLSFAQERLWFLDQLEPESPRYNIFSAFRLEGTLHVPAITRSLSEIVRRHEVLRARFVDVAGRPELLLAPAGPIPLPTIDVSPLSPGAKAPEVERLALAEARRPFRLAEGPLIRALLLRLHETEHVLLLSAHHSAADGWSMEVLTRELWALYEAFSQDMPSPLPELPIQYADFAAWQRQWLHAEALEGQLAYWRRRLEGLGSLELPTDRPRPTVQGLEGAHRVRPLPGGLMDRVTALGQREGVTPFMILLAAFATLLSRYSGQDDIAVGCPIANRVRAEVQGLIGFFANILILRIDLSGEPTFLELVGRVRDVTLGAYAHPDVPLQRLVKELRPERRLSRSPLFQVAFVLQSAFGTEVRLPGLTVTAGGIDSMVSQLDLTLYMSDAEPASSAFKYSTDLFEAATVDRMAGHLQSLLEAAVEKPDRRLHELPLLGPDERRRMRGWEAGLDVESPPVHERFAAQAARSPEALAATFGGESVTYASLEARANRLANRLRRMGVGVEARVGIAVERSLDMVVGLLGILKAGGAYVPLDPSDPRDRLAFMVEDSGVSVLLTLERWLPGLPVQGVRVLCLDRDGADIAGESGLGPESGVTGDNLAYVMYTSGSTGQPKGVAISHRAVSRLVLNTDYVRIEAADRVAQASNAFFDAATFEVWGALLNGACLVGIDRELTLSPRDLGAALREQRVTTLFLTTALFHHVVREDAAAFSGLSHLLCGGDALDPERVRDVLRSGAPRRLLNAYGPTETTTFATWQLVVDVAEEARTVPIGRPIANARVYVLDEQLSPVPVGVRGELFIGGDGLARGYWRRPDLTAEKFVPDPFSVEPGGRLYRTGDLVKWLPDGTIEFLGRKDHQVKLRGFRIEFGEIESVLGRHPAVKDAAVVVREDDPGDKRLWAYVVWKANAGVTSRELRSWLGARLPGYMLPSAVVGLDALPLNSNNKLDRNALAASDRPSAGEDPRVAPRDALEQMIATAWRDVLGVPKVGIDDNFFDAGGNSLLLVRVRYSLEQSLGRPVAVVELFRHPTIRALATFLQDPAGVGARIASGRDRARARRSVPTGRPRARASGPRRPAAV